MKRRLYFLLPDHDQTAEVFNEMLLARIPESKIHVLAKPGSDLSELPEANILQSSDIIHSLESGAIIGAMTGLVLGLMLLAYPAMGDSFTGGMVLAITLAGAIVGSWGAALIGISVPNTRLKKFKKAVENGAYLMMVDVPVSRVKEISRFVREHHRDAKVHASNPEIPAYPLGGMY